MKLSKTTALVLCAFSGSLAFAAEPASNVTLYGVLDTGVYAHHASNGKTIVEMASGITIDKYHFYLLYSMKDLFF